ncbi:SMP-30/gluconolactonase/LRE family protein [Maricurvus nonylphenolicus]|uniref:SMP-30/gluconolactonase/LRE family protein n=1 Tax=Maricurvus nonylphenolicus TaxID=1008307 RepID=UPI0036F1A94C
MKILGKLITVMVMAVILYFAFWPVAVEPIAWQAPEDPGYQGAFAPNDKLANFTALNTAGQHGPEGVVVDQQGYVYATTHEGWVIRWAPGAEKAEPWVETGGRPLGLDLDKEGNLWVADAFIGLLKIDTQGKLHTVLTEADGVPILYADDLVVTPNGKVYLSDASTKFSAKAVGSTYHASLLDIMEHGLYGRIIEFDPNTNQSKVIMTNLSFANGVTADVEGNYLLVNETGEYRVWKYWLAGERQGESEVVIDNLPGFPDNIVRGEEGRFWLGLVSPRLPILDNLAGKPGVRKAVQRLPGFLRPGAKNYGHIVAIDGDGNVLHSLQDPAGAYPQTTGAIEAGEYLYVSSLTAPVLARLDKAELDL